MGMMRWKPLPAFQSVPALLVSPDFGPTSYTIHVTDLANVWVETLDRKGIVKRSLNEDTSIDPTEGADQMVMLLTKIQAAFDPSAPDHDQTSVSLKALLGDDDEGNLALTISCILPGGLKPLEWPFQLTKCPLPSIASELVLPLIQAQHTRALEIEGLIASLKEKDAVINKLVNKLENTGIGLEDVFNALSGKRKASRGEAEARIKGLGPFEEHDWRLLTIPDEDVPGDMLSLMNDVFSEPIHRPGLGISASNGLIDWWTKIGSKGVTVDNTPSQAKISQQSKVPELQEPRLAADEDDDFQVQATPPLLASRTKGGTDVGADDTTDEDEVEALPDTRTPSSQQKASRLGTIGRKKGVEPPRANQSLGRTFSAGEDTATESDDELVVSPPQKRVTARLGTIRRRSKSRKSPAKSASPIPQQRRDDEDTASETDEASTAKAMSPEPSKEPPIPRKVGSLGRLRVQARQASVTAEGETSLLPEDANGTAGSPAKPAKRKLGMVGKKTNEEKRAGPVAPQEQPEEEETEEQRAERKRAELAKELERKAAAGPAKKKRRF
ncbi:XRCC4-like factor-domain-containing protein [Xylariales sp. AK1849]|nr:XRCC4-like factor-domain-containing protein [Xylariales sp. AK1849]